MYILSNYCIYLQTIVEILVYFIWLRKIYFNT